MQVISRGSVRADLLGGTLDLPPIDTILNSKTINMALDLYATVKISPLEDGSKLIINSEDYNSTNEFNFKMIQENLSRNRGEVYEHFEFVVRIISIFLENYNFELGLKVELSSGSPHGAGLGGSSAMGCVLYKALCEFFSYPFDELEGISKVRECETVILKKGPAGYQDYFPAYYSGILCLSRNLNEFQVEQIRDEKIINFLENHITLVFSNIHRNSGINNWEVYKDFFDNSDNRKSKLREISSLTQKGYEFLKSGNASKFLECIIEEGALREKLFSGIVPNEVKKFLNEVEVNVSNVGVKMCGAGGGGCFLLIHPGLDSNDLVNKDFFKSLLQNTNMRILPFAANLS